MSLSDDLLDVAFVDVFNGVYFFKATVQGQMRYFSVDERGRISLALDSMKPFEAAYGFEVERSDLEKLREDLKKIPGMSEAIEAESKAR